MKSIFSSLFFGWRVALLLVAVSCLTPGQTFAECGDYVVIRNAQTGTVPHASATSRHSSTTSPEPGSDLLKIPIPAKTPCHGPNCSGAPAHEHPPLVPVTSLSNQLKKQAQSSIPVEGEARTNSSFDRDQSSPHPIRRASSVFHPPRHI